jgi:hypothetical protein
MIVESIPEVLKKGLQVEQGAIFEDAEEIVYDVVRYEHLVGAFGSIPS